MGLRLDGEENVSTVMDHHYAEPRRPRSRDRSRKNSLDKNHRSSGEQGLNGSRPVPVEKPLSLIINRNESFENGHYSSSKGDYNNLVAEELTKKAFEVVHFHSSGNTPISSVINSGPSTSSSVQNTSFHTPPRLVGRQEEQIKKRNVVEKVEKMRDSNKMETFVSQVDISTANQITVNVRRYARTADKNNLPDRIRTYILEGTDCPITSAKVKNNAPSCSKSIKVDVDGDATDYSDQEDNMDESCVVRISSSTAEWIMVHRAEHRAKDEMIGNAIYDAQQEIQVLTNKLNDLEKEEEMIETEQNIVEYGCAREIPFDRTKRKKVIKTDKCANELVQSTSTASFNDDPSFHMYAAQYMYRASAMGSFHIRKNINKMIWHNSRELEDEKMRNGVRKKEERDRREKRKMERAEKEEEEEKSDEYEFTDDDEEEVPLVNHAKKNGAPKDKKRRKDTERKISRREANKTRRISDCPPLSGGRLSSVTSRPSLDGEMDYHTPSFNHSHWLDTFKSQMPTNFTYNKIPVPECKRVPIEDVKIEETDNIEVGFPLCIDEGAWKEEIIDSDIYSTERMMRKIAIAHHDLEHEERMRFAVNPRGVRVRVQRVPSRDQREESQGSTSGSTPSNRGTSMEAEEVGDSGTCMPPPDSIPLPTPPVPSPAPTKGRVPSNIPTIPLFDYNSVKPITDYERLSIEPPYERRKFSR